MNLIFRGVKFRSFVLLPNSTSKSVDSQSMYTSKLIVKTTASYVYAHEQFRLSVFSC